MNETIQITEVAIRCQACNGRCDLADAVKLGWRACVNCGTFVCDQCLEEMDADFPCLSSVCLAGGRPFEPEPIPVDRVLVFARAQQTVEMADSLLTRLFFADMPQFGAQPYVLKALENRQGTETTEPDDQAKVQAETWAGHHLVITRRKRGQFVTWERVY